MDWVWDDRSATLFLVCLWLVCCSGKEGSLICETVESGSGWWFCGFVHCASSLRGDGDGRRISRFCDHYGRLQLYAEEIHQKSRIKIESGKLFQRDLLIIIIVK